jgi:hypothetical protein
VKEKVKFGTSCGIFVELNLIEVLGLRLLIEHDHRNEDQRLYYQMKGEIEIFVIQINLSTY